MRTEISLKTFIQKYKDDLMSFSDFWEAHETSNNFPEEMEEGEWMDQMILFLDLNKNEN